MDAINWYPGHMKKTKDLIRENLKLVDLVLEVADARIPEASRSADVRETAAGKPSILVLNKRDLADPVWTKRWERALSGRVTSVNSRTGEGTGRIVQLLTEAGRVKASSPQAVGKHRPLRVMVVGVPNVGKSSLINRLTGRKGAKTGNQPGVTRGKQWLSLKNGMQLLDMPGILAPKLTDQTLAQDLAFCGSIRDEILDTADLGLELIRRLTALYPDFLQDRYQLEELPEDPLETMEAVAAKRGCILTGGRIDYERTARLLIDEFRGGKIGRITLEWCERAADGEESAE